MKTVHSQKLGHVRWLSMYDCLLAVGQTEDVEHLCDFYPLFDIV